MGLILKVIFLYWGFVIIRGVFRGFFIAKHLKKKSESFQEQRGETQGPSSRDGNSDIFDAEFKVINKSDKNN